MTDCITQNTNITKKEKITSLKQSQAVCTIQAGCTANGVEKKLDEIKSRIYPKTLALVSNCNIYYMFVC